MRRWHIERRDILFFISRPSTLRRTIYTLVCLVTLLGSSFRPMPGPEYAKGSEDPDLGRLAGGGLVLPSDNADLSDRGLYYAAYVVQKGDTLSSIANAFDVSIDTVVSFNRIQSAKSLQPDSIIKIPSMSGILYTAQKGDTAGGIAERMSISADRIVVANKLMSEQIPAGETLFLPDAKMPLTLLREISGDMFRWPIRGLITSWFGWRRDPFSGRTTFHNALDIGAPIGVPIGAAMEGRIATVGYSPITGKYLIINHGGGWTTLYAHMSVISVTEGQSVGQGERIGRVGNTGYTTGPHLHFSIYKYGKALNPANLLP